MCLTATVAEHPCPGAIALFVTLSALLGVSMLLSSLCSYGEILNRSEKENETLVYLAGFSLADACCPCGF
jgi:hypothetical protein